MKSKKPFWKTAIAILKYLVENWEEIHPLVEELIKDIKDAKEQTDRT